MTKSVWGRVLGLAWVLYGSIELSRALYYFIHIRVLVRGSDLRDFIGVAPFWVLLALLIVGGVGMVLGRRWAWTMTLVVALLYSVFLVFTMRGIAYVWSRFHPPIGDVALDISPRLVIWFLTSWTVVRFLSRPKPWHTEARSVAP